MANPQTPAPSDERVYTDEHLGLELFWEKNKSRILFLIAGVVALILAAGVWLLMEHNKTVASGEAFANATNPEQWREVMQKYPRTNAALASGLLLAASQRESGDVDTSTATYNELLQGLPDKNSFAGLIHIGLAQNSAVAGKMEESIQHLREAAALSGDAAANLARLLEGRELSDTGKYKEARQILEALQQEAPDTLAARIAAGQLQQISIVDPNAPATR